MLETNVHYPTDVNLLYDSGRKCLDMMRKAVKELGGSLEGWRKLEDWHRRLRRTERKLTHILGRGGKNREARLREVCEAYLDLAKRLSDKLDLSMDALQNAGSGKMLLIVEALIAYQQLLLKHIDLVRRRLLEGETIPHDEKLFSIFEQHTEWISKGKRHKHFELGHNVLIATDQFHFIIDHTVVEKQHDTALAVPLAKRICENYDQKKLKSISFDRGFYSQPNYENLQKCAYTVILPKPGKKSQAVTEREAAKPFVRLRHKHSGVEANINQLEHHGLNTCPDKGIQAFKRYTAFGVLAYNIHRLGNALIKQEKEAQARKLKKRRCKATKQAA